MCTATDDLASCRLSCSGAYGTSTPYTAATDYNRWSPSKSPPLSRNKLASPCNSPSSSMGLLPLAGLEHCHHIRWDRRTLADSGHHTTQVSMWLELPSCHPARRALNEEDQHSYSERSASAGSVSQPEIMSAPYGCPTAATVRLYSPASRRLAQYSYQ